MALYTVTEFADLCGKSKAYISTYASRGKIIKSGKFIDDRLQENIDFMRSCGIDVSDISASKKTIEPIELDQLKPMKKTPAAPVITDNVVNNSGQYEMNLQKMDADIALKEQRLILLQLEEERLRGQQIPTRIVRDLISALSSEIINSYKELADKFLIELAHSTKIPGKRSAELKAIMIDMINKAHDNAISEAVVKLDTVINDQVNGKSKK